MTSYDFIDGSNAPIKAWTRGVPIEDAAMAQLRNVASLPFIHSHVAVMPDVHWGMGATVGSVIPTIGAIIPAAVGVDIGCGMAAVRTSIRAEHLPDDLAPIRSAIEAAVPHGRTDNGGRNDIGAWADEPPAAAVEAWTALKPGYDAVIERNPKAAHARGLGHLGTLGTGNHFVELCLDEDGAVWVMLHSGSRGVGNRFGSTSSSARSRTCGAGSSTCPTPTSPTSRKGRRGSWTTSARSAGRNVTPGRTAR
jgi:tRNA-splicing ligase RtcB